MDTPAKIFCDFHTRDPERRNRYFTFISEVATIEVGASVLLSDDESLECVATLIAKDYERGLAEFQLLSPLRSSEQAAPGPSSNATVEFSGIWMADSDVSDAETVFAHAK